MYRIATVAFGVALVAACATPSPESATIRTPYDELVATPIEEQPVFAFVHLVQRQNEGPQLTPICTAVRDSRRVTDPATPQTEGLYANYPDAFLFIVQCGALSIASTPLDEKWLVAFPRGAPAPVIEHCMSDSGEDRCP